MACLYEQEPETGLLLVFQTGRYRGTILQTEKQKSLNICDNS